MKSILYTCMLLSLFLYNSCCKCVYNDYEISFTFKEGATPDCFLDEETDTITVYQLERNTTTKLDSVLLFTRYFKLPDNNITFPTDSFWLHDYLIQPREQKISWSIISRWNSKREEKPAIVM